MVVLDSEFADPPGFPPKRWSNLLLALSIAIIVYLSGHFSIVTFSKLNFWLQSISLVPFVSFVTMLWVSLYLTFTRTPGYLPATFKVPLTEQGYAPIRILRLYKMRTWLACKTFEKKASTTNTTEGDNEHVSTLG